MMSHLMTGPSGQSYVEADDVFDLLFDDPGEAAEARARATLIEYLREAIAGWTQAEAAMRLGTTQPRVSALVRGKVEAFSLSALVKYVTRLGAQPIVTVRTEHAVPPDPEPVAYNWTGTEAAPLTDDTWASDPVPDSRMTSAVVAAPDAAAATDYSFQLAA